MTTQTHIYPTIFDAHQIAGEGSIYQPPIELLTKANEIFDFMPWIESNDTHVHKTLQRAGLPTVYYKTANRGTIPSAGTFTTVLDPMVTLTSIHQLDPQVLKGYANPDQVRYQLESGHPIALGNKHGDSWFYGVPSSDSGEILGMAQRYSDPTAGNGDYILSGGGTSDGDQTSVWVFAFGPSTVFGVYPRGAKGGGLEINRLPMQMVPRVTTSGSTDGQLRVETTEFQLTHGICLADYRAGVRICNIDVPDLKAATNGQALSASTHLFKVLSRAVDRVASIPNTTVVICANQTVSSYMRVHAMDKTVNVLGIQDGLNQFGMPRSRLTFQGFQVVKCESILNTEDDIAGTIA